MCYQNFEDAIAFLQDLGDEKINVQFQEGSQRATYIWPPPKYCSSPSEQTKNKIA